MSKSVDKFPKRIVNGAGEDVNCNGSTIRMEDTYSIVPKFNMNQFVAASVWEKDEKLLSNA